MNKITNFFLTLILLPNICFAEVLTTYSINSDEMQNILKLAGPDTLILIDIDDTIITPKSKMFSYQLSPYRTFIDDLITQANTKPYLNATIAAWFAARKVTLVEAQWPDFIEKLKATGAQVIGFTQMKMGAYNVMKDPEDWQYRELKQLNINFTNKINKKQLLDLGSLNERHAVFYEGIIFTGPFSKGKTLIEFLKIAAMNPKKIINIDKRVDNLTQVKHFLRTFDLKYYSFHYLGVKNISTIPDPQVVQLQQQTLLRTDKWLEDDEAERILENNKS